MSMTRVDYPASIRYNHVLSDEEHADPILASTGMSPGNQVGLLALDPG